MEAEPATLSNIIAEYAFPAAKEAGARLFSDAFPAAKEAGARLFSDLIDGTYGDESGNLITLDSFYAQLAFVVLILGILGGLLTLATADLVKSNSPNFVEAISEGIEAVGLHDLFSKVDDVLGQGAGLVHQAGGTLAQAPHLAAQAAEDFLVNRVGLQEEAAKMRRRR